MREKQHKTTTFKAQSFSTPGTLYPDPMVTRGIGLGLGDPAADDDSSEDDGSVIELVREVRGKGVGTATGTLFESTSQSARVALVALSSVSVFPLPFKFCDSLLK